MKRASQTLGIAKFLLGITLMVSPTIAKATGDGDCDDATFHLYGTEVDDRGVPSVLVMEYDLLGFAETSCLIPKQFPIIVPKSELFCETEIENACGLPGTLFKRWSFNVFPSAVIFDKAPFGGQIVESDEAEDKNFRVPNYFSVKTNAGKSLLHILAARADEKTVARMVGSGTDIDIRDDAGRTPLHEAVSAGRARVVKMFASAGAKLNTIDESGRSPLHDAAASGNTDIVKILLDHGADRDAVDSDGKTPLQIATDRRHWPAAALLGSNANEE